MKTFGIGCYHFWFETPAKIKVRDYLDSLLDRLERINTISEINIEIDEIDTRGTIDVDECIKQVSESGVLIPHLNIFRLSFSIFIPKRIQRELTKKITQFNTATEHFKVTIIHGWYFSFSIVECQNCIEEMDPSNSVIIVREFLRKEFSHKNDETIKFDFLGPSPFHADFFLSESESDSENLIDHQLIKTNAYDTVNFTYDSSKISEEDAFELIIEELSSEIGFYYLLISEQIMRHREWGKLEEQMSDLIDNKRKGIFENIKLIFLNSKIDNLINEIAKFKLSEIFYKQQLKNFYGRVYNNGRHKGYIKDIVSEDYNELLVYPVEEFYDLIKLISDRNRKKVELSILFFAAICGGLVGSIITVAFT